MNKHYTLYIIPKNEAYVQDSSDFSKWEKTDRIDYNTPTCIFINDSIATRNRQFVVVYKGMMQDKGGSGSCYNPISSWHHPKSVFPVHGELHMSEWRVFDWNHVFEKIVYVKWELLKKMGYRDKYAHPSKGELPFWLWDCEDMLNGMYGIMTAKLDAIAFGQIPSTVLQAGDKWKAKQKLLTY